MPACPRQPVNVNADWTELTDILPIFVIDALRAISYEVYRRLGAQ
jgi:hypothetical protein